MARISTPPIPYKMYRHFAIATVAITALMALFAQGETKEREDEQAAVVAAANQAAPRTGPTAKPTPRYGQPTLIREDSGAGVGGGSDFYGEGDFGRPTDRSGNVLISTAALPAEGSENAGFTRDYLDSLSDEELEELLQRLQAEGIESEADRRQAIMVMEAGSRRRSGRATSDE